MTNIVLCGFMGSGKTIVGKELAKIMGCKFVDTDELIEKEQGVAIKAIFATHGEDYFRDLEHDMCKKVATMKNCVVSTGGGAMTYQRNVDAIKEGSKVVFLDASFDVICDRIGDSTTRPLFRDRQKARELYNLRKDKYLAAADYVIDGDMSARKTALEIASIFK
ncbi:MAG: shikimate kinase [Eubacteriales bacterium]|nr:shikimate kinase [Eubacteriales bacterium]